MAHKKVTTTAKTFEAISECFRSILYYLGPTECVLLQSCSECPLYQHLLLSSRSKASWKFEQAMACQLKVPHLMGDRSNLVCDLRRCSWIIYLLLKVVFFNVSVLKNVHVVLAIRKVDRTVVICLHSGVGRSCSESAPTVLHRVAVWSCVFSMRLFCVWFP